MNECVKNGVYGAIIDDNNTIFWFVGDLYKKDNKYYFVYDNPVTLEEINLEYLFDKFLSDENCEGTYQQISRRDWNEMK